MNISTFDNNISSEYFYISSFDVNYDNKLGILTVFAIANK